MDSTSKIVKIYFTIIFTIGLLIFFVFFKINTPREEYIERILPMSFNGRITNKYIDYKNHATKIVIFKNKDQQEIKLFDIDWYPLYDKSEIGDSIYKNEGSFHLYILDIDKNLEEFSYNQAKFYIHKRDWLSKIKNKQK